MPALNLIYILDEEFLYKVGQKVIGFSFVSRFYELSNNVIFMLRWPRLRRSALEETPMRKIRAKRVIETLPGEEYLENFSLLRLPKDMTMNALSAVFWVPIANLMHPSGLKKPKWLSAVLSRSGIRFFLKTTVKALMPNIEGISLWISSFLYCLKHPVPVQVAYKIPRILSAFHLIVVKPNPNQLLTN